MIDRYSIVLMHGGGNTDAWVTVAKRKKGLGMCYIKDILHSSKREQAHYIRSTSARKAIRR